MAKETKQIRPDWGLVLSDKGVIVSLVVRWFKGQVKLLANDLDLDKQAQQSPEFAKLLSLGRKLLIPKDVFDAFHRIETRARSLLLKYSFETPFGQFVPYAAFAIFEQKMMEIEEEFRKATHDMIANYSKYRGQVLEDYSKLGETLFTNGNARVMRAQLIAAVRKSMPAREYLGETYEFAWQPFHIATPSELVKDQNKADVLAEGKAIKFQVNKLLAAKYEKKSARAIDSFINQSIKQMRGVANELVVAALKSIDKNDGVLVPRLSTTLKGMTENFKLMNVWGDEEIEKKLVSLKQYLADTDGEGSTRTPKVKEMLKELRASLKERIGEENLFLRQTRKGVEL